MNFWAPTSQKVKLFWVFHVLLGWQLQGLDVSFPSLGVVSDRRPSELTRTSILHRAQKPHEPRRPNKGPNKNSPKSVASFCFWLNITLLVGCSWFFGDDRFLIAALRYSFLVAKRHDLPAWNLQRVPLRLQPFDFSSEVSWMMATTLGQWHHHHPVFFSENISNIFRKSKKRSQALCSP